MHWFCSRFPLQVVGVVFVELPIDSLQIGSQVEDVTVLYNGFTKSNLMYSGLRVLSCTQPIHIIICQ